MFIVRHWRIRGFSFSWAIILQCPAIDGCSLLFALIKVFDCPWSNHSFSCIRWGWNAVILIILIFFKLVNTCYLLKCRLLYVIFHRYNSSARRHCAWWPPLSFELWRAVLTHLVYLGKSFLFKFRLLYLIVLILNVQFSLLLFLLWTLINIDLCWSFILDCRKSW